ncbi:MAG: MotA/TolQ/ExbB proton channel family protein [Hydrocarboniphaga sp.]|uniref:MotA/TolQ/ExbB proton channel family protein n=1 Tax=Hydrocarboniphaga sp. TaxID=2033016 RepID=UPI00280E359D|nr:MotA/TolQ/ExbB proton channel family protein [Hydrocarboniphaga sp.]
MVSIKQLMSALAGAALVVLSSTVFAQDPAPAAPTAEATTAAEAPLAEAKTESVENPYGIGALWAQGDFVARFVLVAMLIMSGATWYIMVVKYIDQSKLMRQSKAANATFWKSRSVQDGIGSLSAGSPFWYIADRGVSAQNHHEGTLVEQIDLSSWVTMSVNRAVDEIQSRLQGGLAVLATVGSTAPFVGLFGTVWGIYHALTAIGISGQASIDKVAGPVGEALIMTAIGLAVAVPAVMGYNWLVRRNKAGMEAVRAFSADLHSVLLSGSRVGDKA